MELTCLSLSASSLSNCTASFWILSLFDFSSSKSFSLSVNCFLCSSSFFLFLAALSFLT